MLKKYIKNKVITIKKKGFNQFHYAVSTLLISLPFSDIPLESTIRTLTISLTLANSFLKITHLFESVLPAQCSEDILDCFSTKTSC